VQIVLPMVLAGLLAAAVIVYFYRDHMREKKLRLRVEKLYASQLFEDMMPLIRYARRYPVERLSVDKTGVVLRSMQADAHEQGFLMRPNGYAYLTDQQQEAMRTVLEECVPKLQNSAHYHVLRKRKVLLNGDIEYVYQYTISNEYKARLSRAAYYDGTL